MPLTKRQRQKRRLFRQFRAMERRIPALRRPLRFLLNEAAGWRAGRSGLLLMVGGLLSFLPFLGVWMLPWGCCCSRWTCRCCGAPTSALTIRGRRWTTGQWRRMRARGRRGPSEGLALALLAFAVGGFLLLGHAAGMT
jgi:hypothetical protein